MEEGDLNKLFAKSKAAALQATTAEGKAEELIEKGRKRMAQQDGQKVKNKGPDSLQSKSEQDSWLQGLVAAISNPLQIGSSGFDDKGDQVKKNLERNDPRPPIEEPKPADRNIETPPEGGQAQFTLKGLWSKVSNAVTNVLRLKKLLLKLILLAKKAAAIQLAIPRLKKNCQKGVQIKALLRSLKIHLFFLK